MHPITKAFCLMPDCRLVHLGGLPLLSDVRVSQLFRNFHSSSFTQRTRGAAVTFSTCVRAR